MAAPAYPVHVEASLDAPLRRWLWLVKWLLVIPHYIVLFFLWVAFMLLSIVAFFAILVTGRYPASIFEFNVGVLRWSWRVAYYAYGALGTDRYPPFTLADVPDYPAHLDIDPPGELSRGLVLVKWWLLAIPHYLVVAVFTGGGIYLTNSLLLANDTDAWSGGGGLIGLLVFFAAVALLFTGRYPQQLFDFVLGLNRWVLRVAAYSSLMTDDYPPFRLDLGGHDPAGGVAVRSTGPADSSRPAEAVQPGQAATSPQPGGQRPGWSAGRVVSLVLGILLFLFAGGLLTAATTLAVADNSLRDDQGFLMSPDLTVSTSSYALASEPLELHSDTTASSVPENLLGDVRIQATGADGTPLFVGVAPVEDASAFLSGFAHATVTDLEDSSSGDNLVPVYRESGDGAPTELPGASGIWAKSVSGTGEQSLRWDLGDGDYTVVVMNSDGSRAVDADVAVGATFPGLGWVIAGLFIAGGLLLLLALGLIIGAVVSASRTRQDTRPADAASADPPGAGRQT